MPELPVESFVCKRLRSGIVKKRLTPNNCPHTPHTHTHTLVQDSVDKRLWGLAKGVKISYHKRKPHEMLKTPITVTLRNMTPGLLDSEDILVVQKV